MPELEQQIAAWVAAEADGVDPVTAEEAIGRATPEVPAPTRSRRTWAVAAAAAAVLLVGAATVLVVRDDGSSDSVKAGPGTTSTTVEAPLDDGWKPYTEPILGWTLERPISSGVQSWQGLCMANDTGSLITLSGLPGPVERKQITDGCTTAWSDEDLARPGFVALQISHYNGGPYVPPDSIPADTPPGLTLGDLQAEGDGHDGSVTIPGGVRVLTKPVVIDGDHRYAVTAWIDDQAAPEDIADLRRMVRSIRWDQPEGDVSAAPTVAKAAGNPGTSTFTACLRDRGYDAEMAVDDGVNIEGEVGASLVLGEDEEDRPEFTDDVDACTAAGNSALGRFAREFGAWLPRSGPSQTAADAERDGVVPELAAVPLEDRGVALRFTDTTEGTWAFTQPVERFGGAADAEGCLGDRSGRYGVDYVCAYEYSEVVLVDPDSGRLLRAYPFPLPLTWMRVEPDAVYAGRWGDGGVPDSVIVRIDRETLEAQTVLFPYQEPGAPPADPATDLGSLDPEAMGWAVATADQRQRPYFGGNELPGGVLVDSTTGVTLIDRPAIEELFA